MAGIIVPQFYLVVLGIPIVIVVLLSIVERIHMEVPAVYAEGLRARPARPSTWKTQSLRTARALLLPWPNSLLLHIQSSPLSPKSHVGCQPWRCWAWMASDCPCLVLVQVCRQNASYLLVAEECLPFQEA